MREIAIIGAGELGGAVAHALARRDVARHLTIVDESGRVAVGKALDIGQAAPVEGFATDLSGSTDLSAAAGVDLVVIADRVGAGEWQGDDQSALLRRTAQMAPSAIVVAAGTAGRDIVDRSVRELKWPRRRVMGSAPEALAGGARALIALALNGSARDVAVAVLGVPPMQTVIPWEEATIAGFSLMRALDQPTRRALDARIATLWPPGPLALAAAATRVIAAIAGRSRQRACCFVASDVADATRRRTAAWPVTLGASGIAEVVWPSLSVMERVALDNATML
jgi:malate/lactate dehydrogenase